MACVLTVAVLDGAPATQVTIGHVGDSRLYLLRRGEIRKITRDHSPVGMREDAGELSESEAMGHPRRNEIFRDVGSAPHEPDEAGFVDISTIPFDAESALLLCSDGLSDLVPSDYIRAVVEARAGRPELAVSELIDAANEAGGKDNISVVIVEGERYGKVAGNGSRPAVDPLDTTHATTGRLPSSRPPMYGSGSAKPTAGERVRRFLSRLVLLTLLLLLGSAAWYFREPLRRVLGLGGPAERPVAPVLRVHPLGAEGAYRTLSEALEAAQPGQTIEVAPGEYLGPFELKGGVSLVSTTPRAAVIRLPQGTAEPAVTAEGVREARLSGFRIEGNAQAPLEIGLRLADSVLVVENMEISGAATAGVELAGADRSEIRGAYIHDNPGTGIIVRDQAASRLHQNLVLRNGAGPGEPRPGIEIRDMARPQLQENKIEENAAAGVWVPAMDRVDEVFRLNSFGKLPQDKAVRTSPAPPKPAAPATPGATTGQRPPREQ
jgi:hypothetical protein